MQNKVTFINIEGMMSFTRGAALLLVLVLVGGFASANSTDPLDPLDARRDSARLSTGVTLDYVERGENNRKVVIFIHGYLHSQETFVPLMEALGPQYHTYAVTLRGHGNSDKPETGYSMGEMAEDVVALMDHLGIDQASIVGHSMGGVVAQRLAVDHPERVEDLVLLATTANAGINRNVLEFQYFTNYLLQGPIDPNLVAYLYMTRFFYQTPLQYLASSVAETLKVPLYVWQDSLNALVAENMTGELEAIQAPTLLIWGENDTIFTLAEQEALNAGIADSSLITYPETGHDLHLERVDQIAADLEDFWR